MLPKLYQMEQENKRTEVRSQSQSESKKQQQQQQQQPNEIEELTRKESDGTITSDERNRLTVLRQHPEQQGQ